MKKEIKYFDVHSHLHSDFFNQKKNGQKVASEMKKKGIYSTIIGVNFADSQKAVKMAQKNENIFSSIGVHPVDEKKENWDNQKFQKLFQENKTDIVCIGECGLDYYWPNQDLKRGKISEADFASEKKRQKKLFQDQIDFAARNNLPLMLHIRSFRNADAHWDAFKILDQKQKEYFGKIRANFHFFTEGRDIVKEIIKRSFLISLPGVITFADLEESILEIPMDNLMVETDSPFAAPVPYRGKVNTPVYVKEVLKKVSEIKKIDFEYAREKSIKNALEYFNIK